MKNIVGAFEERCLFCSGKRITRKGRRRKKFETIQLWYCRDCDQVFTPRALKGKTYPIPVILDGLGYYNTGYSLETSAKRLKERYGIMVTPTTLSRWLREFKELTTYARLRESGMVLFPPHQVIQSTRLHHRQVYHYRIHRAKLELLLNDRHQKNLAPLSSFLLSMAASCPHRLFRQEGRGSDIKVRFDTDGVSIREKQNFATRISQLALQGVSQNKRRHDSVQKFMLLNDYVTVATEVPVYLIPEDIQHFKSKLGFQIPFEDNATLTGHIDALQVRNGALHILDYKPNARHEKPIEQLTFYALALSRRTGLRLYDFKCAWFDENHYFEFFPLHVVLKKSRKVIFENRPSCASLKGKNKIILHVRANSTRMNREKVLNDWYRNELRTVASELLPKWQEKIGVQAKSWGIKRMKTRWGTCTQKAGRIWLNLELAKKPIEHTEYVLVHELLHLIEKTHNENFVGLMTEHLPKWRSLKVELNRFVLSHVKWNY